MVKKTAKIIILITLLTTLSAITIAGIISSTEYGLTFDDADADQLNTTVNTAEIVDGVLVMQANNSGNWTIHDGFYTDNSSLTGRPDGHSWLNFSRTANNVSLNVSGGKLNMSMTLDGGAVQDHLYIRSKNISIPASGLLISVDIQDRANSTSSSNDFLYVGIQAFVDNLGEEAIPTQTGEAIYCRRNWNGLSVNRLQISETIAGSQQASSHDNTTVPTQFGNWMTFRAFVNTTHVMCMVNNTAWSPLTTHSCGECTSGSVVLNMEIDGGNTGVSSMLFANISAVNVSGTFSGLDYASKLPLGYDNSTFEIIVFNETASVDKLNLTLNFYENQSTTSTRCFVADSNHINSQEVSIGTGQEDITDITGIMLNCSIGSNDVKTSPVVNFLNISYVLVTIPSIPQIIIPVNGNITSAINVSINATNISDAGGDTLTQYWYFDGIFNHTTAGNTSGNFSDGTHNITVSSYDGASWSANASYINFTVDTTIPLVFSNSSTATVVDSPGNILVNITDVGSNISSVTFEVNDTNGAKTNFSMSLNSGANTPGQNTQWLRAYTPASAGTYTGRFWATDLVGNIYRTPDDTLSWAAAAPTPSSGGGGGGGTNTLTIINQSVGGFCGDNICQEGEFCSVDCAFFSVGGDIGGVARFILVIMVVGVLILAFRKDVPIAKDFNTRRFKRVARAVRKGNFEVVRREGKRLF